MSCEATACQVLSGVAPVAHEIVRSCGMCVHAWGPDGEVWVCMRGVGKTVPTDGPAIRI